MVRGGDIGVVDNDDGCKTLALATGAYQVAQQAGINTVMRRGQVWHAMSRGIDYANLFQQCFVDDDQIANARRSAMREAVLRVPGVIGFEGAEDITFTRTPEGVVPKFPCIKIDCQNSRFAAKVPAF